jgi:GPH family glycoside/pentoside/hexuronide:cation symporter
MNHSPDAIPLKARSESLSLRTKLAYGVGELGGEIPNNILVFFLLFFLTSVAGLNPTLAGSVLLIGKVWDAINDPIVGILSDRTRSPLGRRYPWMLVGAIPLGVCFFLQYRTAARGDFLWLGRAAAKNCCGDRSFSGG